MAGPIQLHAAHPVVRSYVHVGDLVELAFAIMMGQKAAPREAFDTAGDGEIEVGELAKLVASVLGESGMEIQRPPLDDTPADRYVGDSAMIQSLARSYGIEMKTLSTQIQDTAEFMMAVTPASSSQSTFHGASPLAQSASRMWSSRRVSTGCQKPWWRKTESSPSSASCPRGPCSKRVSSPSMLVEDLG